MKKIYILIFAFFLAACGQEKNYEVITLESGKEIKIVGLTKNHNLNGDDFLSLTYLTEIEIKEENDKLLNEELDEVWPVLRSLLQGTDFKNATLDAIRIKASLLIFDSRSGYRRNYKMDEHGSWNLNHNK